jgi:ribosome recycling factor
MLYDQDKLKKDLSENISVFQEKLRKIRTGRASKEVLDNIKVLAYGSETTLSAVSNLVFEGPMSVVVNVWDKSLSSEVRKSLESAKLGASITDHGDTIRINFNPLTEEIRKEKVKELGKLVEEFKVRMRLTRQDFMQEVKSLDSVSEDEQKASQESIQKDIDSAIKDLESIAKEKEKDLLSF